MRDGERRLTMVLVDERALLELFSPLGQCVSLRLNNPKLPEDVRIVSVNHDYNRRALAVTVHSKEFPVVPAGAMIPSFDTDGFCNYEARYVVGDRLTPFKPMAVAIQEQAAARAWANAIGPLYISADLKAKIEACDEIVDHKPLSDIADAARMAASLPMIGQNATQFLQSQGSNASSNYWGMAEEEIKPGQWLTSVGLQPFHFRVAKLGELTDGNNVAIQAAKKGDLFFFHKASPHETRSINLPARALSTQTITITEHLENEPPVPSFRSPIPAEVIAGESSQYGNKDAEAEFFRKSIMAE